MFVAAISAGKTESSRGQRSAALDEETFETRVIGARKKALSGLDIVDRDVKQRAERAVYEPRIKQGGTIEPAGNCWTISGGSSYRKIASSRTCLALGCPNACLAARQHKTFMPIATVPEQWAKVRP